jgi:hypothetical protein
MPKSIHDNRLVEGSSPSGPNSFIIFTSPMKIEPIQNTFLQSRNSYNEQWEKYLKNQKYLPKKKEESKEENLKNVKDSRIIGYA